MSGIMTYEFKDDEVELEKNCTLEEAKKFYKNNAPILVMCTWTENDETIDITRLS